jgi:hypothetical protein
MKLMIGIGLTHSKAYCLADVLSSLRSLVVPDAFTSKGLMFVMNSDSSPFYQMFGDITDKLHMPFMQVDIKPTQDTMQNKVAVRNALLQQARMHSCDALLMLDADICVEPHTLQTMWLCAQETGADAVVVPYNLSGSCGCVKSVFLKEGGELQYITSSYNLPSRVKVAACGMGCILLRGDALYQEFKLTDKPEDLQWCEDYSGDRICCGDEQVRHMVEVKNGI